MNAAACAMSLLIGAATLAAAPSPPASTSGRQAFRVFNEDHGLGNLTVEVLLQDRVGFIWAGTQNGLYRFDGLRFTRFALDPKEEQSTRIFALHEAADGTLYVGTREGLVRREGEGFRPLAASDAPKGSVNGIASRASTVYVATSAGLFEGDGRSFRPVPPPPDVAPAATAVLATADGVLAAYGGALFERDAGGWRDVGTDAGLPRAESIDRLGTDAKGRLFVRTMRSLWMRPSPTEFFVAWHEGLPAGATDGRLERDGEGNPLLPTSRGIAMREGDRWRLMGRDQGLPADVALSALVDREGSLWVGLAGAGLAQRLGSGAFASWGLADGLAHEVVWSIAREAGSLWVGTQEGLSRLDLATGAVRTWRERDGLAGDLVYAVEVASGGGVWAGSWPGGVTRIPSDGGPPRRYGATGLAASDFKVSALHVRSNGDVWAGARSGAFRLASGGTTFEPVGLPGGPEFDGVLAFAENGHGDLFAVGRGGLQRLTGESPRRFTSRDGFEKDFLASIVLLPDDTFVVGYRDARGVARVRVLRDSLELLPLAPRGPLASEKVLFVGRDSADRLWVGGDRGIDVFAADGRTRRRFARADGLLTEDMDQNAFEADADGVVWLGTSRGLVRYEPREPVGVAPPPTVVITEVIAGQDRRLLPSETPVLAREERSLTIDWAGLSFRDPRAVTYVYRMVGLDAQFAPTHRTTAQFAGLGAGRYRFEVAALAADGSTTSAPATFTFSVAPPWWETVWARLATVALLLLLGVAAVRLRTRALDADRRRLEDAVIARNAQLKLANEQLKEASVRDPLTQLHNRRYVTDVMGENVKRVLRAYSGVARGEPVRNQDLVFFLVDADHFKHVNDLHGHPVGDRMLVALAARLCAVVRDSDLVVRWGGEEFLIVARDSDRSEAEQVASRILQSVGDTPFDLGDGLHVPLTCSVGWAALPWVREEPAAVSWEETLVLVDRALYLAKRSGRNQAIGVMPSEHAEPAVAERWWREPFDRLQGRLRTARIAGPSRS